MKKFKKISALVLALLMCFTLMTATVSAIGETGNYIYYNGNGNTGGSAPGRTAFYWTTVDWELNVWAKVSGPGSLTKTGHTFAGWNTSANGTGTSYSTGQWVKSPGHWSGGWIPVYHYDDLNLYAQWTINTYDVTFKTSAGGTINGGTADVVKTGVTYGTSMSSIMPTVTPNTGYHFTGWTPSLPSEVTAGGTYTATFAINTYDVTFKTTTGGTINGGTADVVRNNVTHGTGMSPITPTIAAETGYHFTGWTPSLPTEVTATATYTANFVINTYDVIFITTTGGTIDGGTADVVRNNVTHGTGMSTIVPTVAADEGYTFTGWSPALPEYVTIGGSYTATFLLNTYDVTFKTTTGGKINGGTADILVEDVDHGTLMSTIAPAAVADHGYTFAGWNPVLPEQVKADGTYTAEFTINQYTITFNSMGGSAVAPITQNFNTEVAKPTDPTLEHYTFLGWFDVEGNPINFPYTLTDDITVYAKWKINSYTMMFDSAGGSSVSPVTQNYNTQITQPVNPTRYGFTFSGWYTGENGTGTLVSFPYTLTGNITVHARWTAGTYTMSFDSEGGSAVPSVSGDYGTYITSPATPTKAGFTFEGWYSGDNGTGTLITFPYNLTGNVTVYAKWAAVEVVSEPSVPSVASSQPTTTVSENQTPTDVPSMGNGSLSTAAITIAIFSMLSLAALAVLYSKKRNAVK